MMKTLISNLLAILFIGGSLFIFYNYREEATEILDDLFFPKEEIVVKEANSHAKGNIYGPFEMTSDFTPESYDDLLNITFTVLNSGWDTFFFYCPDEYEDCITDVTSIITNEELLSTMNNFVNPYNSYTTISSTTNTYGMITITPTYSYTKDVQNLLDEKIDTIISTYIKPNMSTRDKIKVIHDYIINHTKYDTNFVEKGDNIYQANTAYGVLVNGYAVCSGYSDAMSLFLDKLEIPNFKIANSNHVWNYVFVDGSWKHLDLTWDDPVSSTGKDRLIYSYFLISDEQLKKLNDDSHDYDKTFYSVAF